MHFRTSYIIASIIFITSCSYNKETSDTMDQAKSACSDNCPAENKLKDLSCKLTTPELRERKATVIASLKRQVLKKRELNNGFAYKFNGSDKMVDELAEFVKTERVCCDFFTFNLSVSGDASEAWLEIVGPEGAKEFITSELEL